MSWLIKMDFELVKQALIQAVTFLLFYTVIKKFFYDKINGILEQRKEIVEKNMNDAKTASENAKKLEADYEEKIAAIDQEKIEILKKAAEDGQATKDRIVSEARVQASSIIEDARAEAVRQQKRAEEEFKDSIVDISIEAAEKVIGKSLNREDHMQLINESIAMLKEV